jgi:hypothetical protein
MTMLDVAVSRPGPEGTGSQTIAIFRVSDDGASDPVLINPPDSITIAALRRGLDWIDAKAAIAAGEAPSLAKKRAAKKAE